MKIIQTTASYDILTINSKAELIFPDGTRFEADIVDGYKLINVKRVVNHTYLLALIISILLFMFYVE